MADDAKMAGVKAAVPRVSYADMERWPEDGRRYELYDGELFEIPSPFPIHQIVLGNLYLALAGCVRAHGGIVLVAPLDIVLTDFDVVQPDLLLFTRERQHLINPRKVTRQPPDLAIEILSPATASNDRGRKLRLLGRHHVREYWLVNADTPAIEVYGLTGDRLLLRSTARNLEPVQSPLLPKLILRPSDLIPELQH
jgi:Uma2 family endonuclease